MARRRMYRGGGKRDRLPLLGWYGGRESILQSISGSTAGTTLTDELLQLSPGHDPSGLDKAVTIRRMRGHLCFEWGGLGSPTSADLTWLSVIALKGLYRASTDSAPRIDTNEIANATPFATCVMEGNKVFAQRNGRGGDGDPMILEFDVKRQWKIRRGESLFLYALSEVVHTGTSGIPSATNVRFSINLRALLSDAGA